MYLPMTCHLESGEFSGTVAKTLERLFVDDFSLKWEPIFDAKLPLKSSAIMQRKRSRSWGNDMMSKTITLILYLIKKVGCTAFNMDVTWLRPAF